MQLTENTVVQFPTNPGEPYVFSCAGDFDGGYLEVRYNDGENSVLLPNGSLSHDNSFTFIAPTRLVDVELAESGAPDLTISLLPVTGDNYSTVIAGIVDTKANDDSVVHRSGAEDISGEKTFYGRVQLFNQASYPGAADAMTRHMVDERRWMAAPVARELGMSDAILTGTGVNLTGNFATDGRSGGYFSGDATSSVHVSGVNSLTGIIGGGFSISWAYRWLIYVQFEATVAASSLFRFIVGTRTTNTADITTVSGSYAGCEWTSNTSVRGFTANAGNGVLASPVTSSPIQNARNHLWLECVGAGGQIRIYHATGFSARMPASPLITLSGAPSGNGGSGFQFLIRGTGASANASFSAINARLLVP